MLDDRPVGIVLSGTAFSEGKLISYAYVYEQATKHRKDIEPYKEAKPLSNLQLPSV
jgi:Asp-tRNA(Asn)/Glu-tRNA(Gln) amidotransferase A subunit family amidase